MSAGRGTPRVSPTGTAINVTVLPTGDQVFELPSSAFNASVDVSDLTPVALNAGFQNLFTKQLLSGATRVAVTLSVDVDSTVVVRPVFQQRRVQEVASRTPGPPLDLLVEDQVISKDIIVADAAVWRLVFGIPPTAGLLTTFTLEAAASAGSPAATVDSIQYDNLTLYGVNTLL